MLALALGLAVGEGRGQVPAGAPVVAPAAAPPDTFRRPAPADTTRRALAPAAPDPAEPDPRVTRPLALRIGGAILLVTLTTLLLYNVRSR